MRKVNPNIKYLFFPLIMTLFVVVLTFFVLTKGYGQVRNKIDDLKRVESEEVVLNKKLSFLRKIRSDVLEKTNVTVLALPEDNPATYLISMIKKHADQVEIPVSKMRIGGGQTGKQEEVISSRFEVQMAGSDNEAGMMPAVAYLELLMKSIPVLNINKVGLSDKSGEFAIDIDGLLYNSKFPTEMPPLTKPIKELTGSDEDLIKEISEMSKPDFFVLSPAEPKEDRRSPFLD